MDSMTFCVRLRCIFVDSSASKGISSFIWTMLRFSINRSRPLIMNCSSINHFIFKILLIHM